MSRIEGNLIVTGRMTPQTGLDIPASSVTDAAVHPTAAISAAKLQHQFEPVYAQASATTAFTESRVLHVVRGATATVEAFHAGSVVACLGAATITVDLKKNGASVLSAPIVLDNANVARVLEAATIASPNLVAGDVLECIITATAGGGTLGTGFFARAIVREAAA